MKRAVSISCFPFAGCRASSCAEFRRPLTRDSPWVVMLPLPAFLWWRISFFLMFVVLVVITPVDSYFYCGCRLPLVLPLPLLSVGAGANVGGGRSGALPMGRMREVCDDR